MITKVTFKNCYKNSPHFFQEATQPGLQHFRQKVKSRTTFIASRELLQLEQNLLGHIFPKQAGASSSE